MESKVILIFALLSISNYTLVNTARASNKVKVMDFTLYEDDKSYFDSDFSETRIIRVNETYNRFQFKLVVHKDFPADAKYSETIIRSKTEDGPWEVITSYVIRLCDETDKYHKYLPDLLIQLTKGGNCLRKGTYKTDDFGMFKFYDLLPAEEIDGYYFASLSVVSIPNHRLSMAATRSVSINAK